MDNSLQIIYNIGVLCGGDLLMIVHLINAPDEYDWMGVKQRALVTIGKTAVTPPSSEWKHRILEARHSPIRYLWYSFLIEDLPSWVATHLVRHHVGFHPYVKSQRNDRQSDYDRNSARQDAPVCMIADINAEALMNIANKRLCNQASKETREVVAEMCRLAEEHTPELKGLLVPMCQYHNGQCHEMYPCNIKRE